MNSFYIFGLPWVALGGGGYDIDAVIRCWCLAYGVMTGNKWPNTLPDNLGNHSSVALRDIPLTCLGNSLKQTVEIFAEENVEKVKKLIFPTHGLG